MQTNLIERNNIKIIGSGSQTIVFAHGFGCDQNMWRFVAPAFEDRFRVVLFDYVGAGKSDMGAYSSDRYHTLDGYALDVLEILDGLELDCVCFVGHSVSGIIGMLAAIRRPEKFSSLVMLGPSPCYLNDPPDYLGGFDRPELEELMNLMDMNYLGWANFLAPLVMKNEDNPALTDELEQSFCSTDPKTAREFAEATFLSDYRSSLPQLSVPSLIVQCSEDTIAPEGIGKYMHAHMAGSTLKQVAATGHCPHLSAPDEIIAVIEDYLSGRDQA